MGNKLLRNTQLAGKPCIHPWSYLWINAAGQVTVCPQNRTRLGSLENLSIDEIWNGNIIQEIRTHFVNEEYEKAGCEKECPYLRGEYKHPSKQIPVEELICPEISIDKFENNSAAKENILSAIENYKNNLSIVSNKPVVFDCQSILSCNADCIMCGQPHSSKLKHTVNIKDKILNSSKYLSAVRWQGGEVFLDKDFMNDVENIAFKGDIGLSKIIITNANLLDEEKIDKLLTLKGDIKFIVSMDGASKTTVETIRRKLKYEKIIFVLEYLSRKQKEMKKNDLVMWNYTVMKSNITEVSEALLLADRLKIDINLAAIQGNYPDENFFQFDIIDNHNWKNYIRQWKKNIAKVSIKVSGLDGLEERFKHKGKI